MKIRVALERLAEIEREASPNDPARLAEMHTLLSEIALWATDGGNEPIASGAFHAAALLETIILGDSADAQRDLMRVRRVGAAIRAFVLDGKAPPEALREVHNTNGHAAELEIALNPETVREFADRANEYIGAAETLLVGFENGRHDAARLSAAARPIHSLRRLAATLRLQHVNLLCSQIVEVYRQAELGRTVIEGAVMDALLDGLAVLRSQTEAIRAAERQALILGREHMMPEVLERLAQAARGQLVDEAPAARASNIISFDKRLEELLVEAGAVSVEAVRAALELQSDASQRQLGRILLDAGAISASQLNDALALQQDDPSLGKLGDILVDIGAVNEAEIQAALEQQSHGTGIPALGESLVMGGAAVPKDVVRAMRAQGTGQALQHFGLTPEETHEAGEGLPAIGTLREFAREAREHLGACDLHLLRLESNPRHTGDIGSLYRRFRAIERVAAPLGLEAFRACAHEAEGLTLRMRQGDVPAEGLPVDLLFDAVAGMRSETERYEALSEHDNGLAGEDELIAHTENLRAYNRGELAARASANEMHAAAGVRLGDILIEEGVVSPEDVEAALAQQADSSERKPIGELLLAQAHISRQQLDAAIEEQQRNPEAGRLGDILVRMGAIAAPDLEATLKAQSAPVRPKLGELLLQAGKAAPKAIAAAIRGQRRADDYQRLGLTPRPSEGGAPSRHDLAREFAARASQHLQAAEMALLTGLTSGHDRAAFAEVHDSIQAIRRIAGQLGIVPLERVAHEAETFFRKTADGSLTLEGTVQDIAFDGISVLQQAVERIARDLETGRVPGPSPALAAIGGRLRGASEGKILPLTRVHHVPAEWAGKRLGDLLVEAGLVKPEQLKAALEEQAGTTPAHQTIGEILSAKASITPRQLEEALRVQQEREGKLPLGAILVEMGVVRPEDVEAALEEQRQPRRPRLGEILVSRGYTSAKSIAQAVRTQEALEAAMRTGATAAITSAVLFSAAGPAFAQAVGGAAGGATMIQVSIDASNPDAMLDTDQDGLLDSVEKTIGTDPAAADTDMDGMDDAYESKQGTNPLDASDAELDLDQDRLTNVNEYLAGTSMYSADTDKDGWYDGIEIERGTNPADANDYPVGRSATDLNADGSTDAADIQAVINAALGVETEFPTNVNRIGGVDALDVQLVINRALGL